MVQPRLLEHFAALALPNTIHPGLALFLRNEEKDDWFDQMLKWVWAHFAMTSRTYYRDVKQIEIEYQASLRR